MKGNKSFINEFNLSEEVKGLFKRSVFPQCKGDLGTKGFSNKIFGLFSNDEIEGILNDINNQNWIPVGIDGILSHYKEGDEIGSYRLSCYEEDFVNIIWDRVKSFLPEVSVYDKNAFTDWDGHEKWEPVGINPLLRFIRYTDKGFLVPHYDGSFIKNEDERSLVTLVIYIENDGIGGATRFIIDPQDGLELKDRDLSDWTDEAKDFQILNAVNGNSGDAIIFDHFLLHDSERMEKGKKTIIRTDIMYRKVLS